MGQRPGELKIRWFYKHFSFVHFANFHYRIIIDSCRCRHHQIKLTLPSPEAKHACKTNIKLMIPKNSKFNACNLLSKLFYIASTLNPNHEGCEMIHAKSNKQKVLIKPTCFWKNDSRTWWESEPTDGSKSPSSTSYDGHMADFHIGSCTKVTILARFYKVF